MIEIISPRDNLILAVAARLRPAGNGGPAPGPTAAGTPSGSVDYSGQWVVFPERRPAYYLRKELAEKARASFIPPVLDSMEGFISRVYEDGLGIGGRLIDPLDAVALLFEIHKAEGGFGQADGRPDPYLSADSFFPLGMKMYNDLEELCLAGARTQDILEIDLSREFAENISAGARGKLQSLASFYEKFYAAAEERGFSTPASRARAVLEGLRPELFSDVEKIIFAGFYSLTRVERRIIQAMIRWENCSLLLMKGRGLEAWLEELGPDGQSLAGGARTDDPATDGPEIEIFKSPDTHGQIFAFNKAMEDGLRGRSAGEKQAVILPAAETLFPFYQQTLTALGEGRFNISMGYPLSRTPIYTFFDHLMELLQSRDEDGRLYAPHYLRFVLHPYTKNIYFPAAADAAPADAEEGKRADLTRILFHAIEEEMTSGRRRAKSFWALEEIEGDAAVLEAVQEMLKGVENPPDPASLMAHLARIHANTVGLFREMRDVGDFASKMTAVLEYIDGNSTARLHQFFRPFAEAFTAQLDRLERSLLRGMAFEDQGEYFNLFRKVIAAGRVPFEGTPLRGLQVLGFWEARCIPFDDVSIMDVNEDVLPSFRREDTLLPFAARKRLGLPTYLENERRMEYYLDTMIRGARKARLFFVDNSDRERSRFIEKIIWEKQKAERERNADRYVKTIQYQVALTRGRTLPVEKSGRVAGFLRERVFSATALDRYLRCPLSFYYDDVLGIEEKEEIGEQMEKKDIGSFVHAILQEYFKTFIDRTLRAEDLSIRELDRIIDRRFEEIYGGDLAGSAYLLNLQVKDHLREFVERYQKTAIRDIAGQGRSLRILGLEQTVRAELKKGHFGLEARLDRVEKRGEDIYILDYKTGANVKYVGINFKKLDPDDRASWSGAIGSLQIPFYELVYSLAGSRPRERVHGRFLMLGKSRIGPGIEYSPYDAGDEAGRREQRGLADAVIAALIEEITDPGRPFEPAADSARQCPACPYAYICDRK
ncbi:MAG: PD-(D/E)XK nuclease family protein [Acidobacteriota bacterium]|nr:PD-(D/E)XK nuclease family protein [Acidobacteriota bacterium]